MEKVWEFNRCIYCFEEKENGNASCPACGYRDGFGSLPGWWMTPGTILKGRYMIGRDLIETEEKLVYFGWDLNKDIPVEITEFFPKKYITRDITSSARVSCIPGMETAFEDGKQAFFEKAKMYFKCKTRVEDFRMDFFIRNHTCYYVREKSLKKPKLS